jgi:hypothetical protein
MSRNHLGTLRLGMAACRWLLPCEEQGPKPKVLPKPKPKGYVRCKKETRAISIIIQGVNVGEVFLQVRSEVPLVDRALRLHDKRACCAVYDGLKPDNVVRVAA